MRRRGISWKDIGLVRPKSLWRAALWVVAIYLTAIIIVGLGVNPISNLLGLEKLDTSAFASIKGNLSTYLIYLIPVSWGAAAFGEEMLFRGFLSRRLLTLFGDTRFAIFIAVLLQATLFGLGHIYLGARGAITAMTVGLIMGMFYFLNKRNLWPLIITHGLMDSVAMTVLYLGYELP
jgi:membrane protease YdiL (CAAX protease family)